MRESIPSHMFYRKDTDHVESEEVIRSRERAFHLLRLCLLLVFVFSFFKVATSPAPWSKSVIQRVEKEVPELKDPKSVTSLTKWIHSEIDHPKIFRAKEHGIIGTWYAYAISAGLSFLLVLTAPVWMPKGKLEDSMEDEAGSDSKGESGLAKLLADGPLFYLMLIGAMAVGAWFRAPMLTHSLWNDEEYAMRRFAHGGYEEGKFEPVTWTETLFENHNGNNHVLHSVLSRVSLSIWHLAHREAKPSEFSETALRMPSLIAGILTIAVLGVLGWEFGLPWLGIGAAWFLALHPWHIRYSTEAKGYSLCLLFICLAIIGLIRAIRHNRIGSWVMFALAEAAFLLSFAGSIYVAVALNFMVVIECLWRRRGRQFASLCAFNAIGAIPVLLMILPSVPQVLGFIDHDNSPRIPANMNWINDLGSHLVIGFQHVNADSTEHLGTSWEQMRHHQMDATSILGWSVALLGFLGLFAGFFETVAGRLGIVAPTLAGALGFWHASVSHHPNLAMYYIYLLIPLGLACALAAVRMQVMPAVLVMLLLVGFGLGTQEPRTRFIEHDRQPIRETVEAVREKHPEALTGSFGVSDRQSQSYDPEVHILAKPADVDALLAKGQQEGRPVFIYFAGLRESTNRAPDLMKRVALSEDFRLYKEFKGLEAMFSYRIYAQPGIK